MSGRRRRFGLVTVALVAAALATPSSAVAMRGPARGLAAATIGADAAIPLPGSPVVGGVVDDAHGHVLIVETDELVALDMNGVVVQTVTNETHAAAVAVLGDVLYLLRPTFNGGGVLATFDADTLAPLASFAVPSSFDSDGSVTVTSSRVWLGNADVGDPLLAFDPTTQSFAGYTLGSSDECGGVIAIPASSLLVCRRLLQPYALLEVDVGTATPTVVLSAPVYASMMTISPDGATIFAGSADGVFAYATSDFSLQSQRYVITRENVSHPTGLGATQSHGGLLAVGSLNGVGAPDLYVFSTATGSPVNVEALGNQIASVVGFSADGTKLYVVEIGGTGAEYFGELTAFTTSTAPPAPTFFRHPPPVDTNPTPTFSFRDAQAEVTFRCALDGGAQVDCTRGAPYMHLPDGPHHLAVVAEFGAENDSVPTTFNWTVQRSAIVEIDPTGWNGSLGTPPVMHTSSFAIGVVNHGTVNLHVTSVTISGPGAASISLDIPCLGAAHPIAPGRVCDAHILLRPLTLGPTGAVLTFHTDAFVPTVLRPVSWSAEAGYWLANSSDIVVPFGDAYNYGPAAAQPLHAPIIDVVRDPDPTTNGYWTLAGDGGLFAYGYRVPFYGSTGALHLNQPVVGMAPTPSGHGYWMVASDGGIFSFGDAHFYGSTGGLHLNQPIVGMAPTPSGHGYWLVARDGGIFAFGDAHFYGSTGAIHLNEPIVGMTATLTGHGYRFVAADGGVFSFGDAHFYGSAGGLHLPAPIVGIESTPTGRGYWMLGQEGSVFHFGDAPGYGSVIGGEPWVALTGSE